MLLSWLGQSGFLLRGSAVGATAILIDPWLSAHAERETDPPSTAFLPDRIDLVLATHGHADHLDTPGLRALVGIRRIGAVLVPTPHAAHLRRALPETGILGVQPGDRIDDPVVRVLRAWHGQAVSDGYTDGLRGGARTPHVSYLVELDGVRVYHAGDSLATAELAADVRAFAPDLALLPVNGRDVRREQAGVLGNMSGAEAVDFAVHIKAGTLVPMHYDGVQGNTTSLAETRAAASRHADLELLIPARETTTLIESR